MKEDLYDDLLNEKEEKTNSNASSNSSEVRLSARQGSGAAAGTVPVPVRGPGAMRRPGRGARLSFPKPWCASGTSVLVPRQKKTRLNVCETSRRVKKFPAPCYSPIVKFTVPSPLEPLTAVFGKGTCVSAPL